MTVASPISVRAMRMSDIPEVHEIERASFAEPWPAHALRQELTGNRLARYLVAEDAGRIVGYAGVWLIVDDAHITTFGVHPDARRRGVGLRLLLAVADLAIELRAARLTLEVRPSNAPARRLYERFGFQEAGRRPRYYSDDGEDALIMTTPELRDPSMQARLQVERAPLGLPGSGA
jgi:ribosomal-protein-alanine N-acetyltransferase